MRKMLVILGPTSTGKTDLGIYLAKKLNGEIISVDSRQVYKGLDIVTGKRPSQMSNVKYQKLEGRWQIDGVNIWLYDVADPREQYNVYEFVKKAEQIIDDIFKTKKLPILVGGTGLYLKALLEGLPNLRAPVNQKLREELSKLSLEDLQEKLKKLSLKRWNELNNSDRNNPRRLLRAIELLNMNPYIGKSKKAKGISKNFNILNIGLSAPREVLNKRIDDRVISRIKQGMIEEGKSLEKNGLTFERMRELGLEIGCIADYLEGKLTYDKLIEKLKIKIHQYAKRQMTWIKKEKDIHWFDISQNNWRKKVETKVANWYDQGYR